VKEKEAKKQERFKKWAETEMEDDQDELPELTDTTAVIPEPSNTSTDEHLLLRLRGSDNKDIVLRVKKVLLFCLFIKIATNWYHRRRNCNL
jgi:hypothetical protein